MPPSLKKEIDGYVKEGSYASTSEFFRDVIRAWKRERLIADIRESQRDFKAGRYKVLRSFKDLR